MGEETFSKENVKYHLRRWHGFTTNVDAIKAMVWIVTVSFVALAFAFDQRYAKKDVEEIAFSTWEVTILSDIEHARRMLCRRDISQDYRTELDRRLALRIAEYEDRKSRKPYVPSCGEAPPVRVEQ